MPCFALNLQSSTWDVEHATFRVERDQIDSELLQVERKRIFVCACVCSHLCGPDVRQQCGV